jgi:RHS repeat-associated protein
MGFAIDENDIAVFRMNDGRVASFELPLPGKFTFNRSERLFLHCHAEEKFYYITDCEGLIYRFTDKIYTNEHSQTECQLIQSIANRNGYAIRFEYNRKGYLIKIIDSAGRILTVQNDYEGRITSIHAPHPEEKEKTFAIASYAYDEEGNMICHTDALGQKMTFEYENHLLVKETWRNGQQWYFVYEDKTTGSRCIHTWGDGDLYNHKLTYLEGCTLVENSLGHITTYYHKGGLVYRKTDANRADWEYRHNKFNELEWETDPLGNQHAYAHDEWGNLSTSTDPCGGFTHTEYYHPQFPYLPTEGMDAAGGKWKWEYDAQGNLIEQSNPLGAKTQFFYTDGLQTEIISASGAVTQLAYDRYQNLIKILTDDDAITQYEYDILGNCTEVINPNHKKQKRFFDTKGRIVLLHDFDENVIRLEYDALDNVVHYKDRLKDVQYSYRGLWKLISRTEAGASIYFNYDTEEQLRKLVNEHGLPYRFELDAVGNIIEEIDFDNISRRFELNAVGWITKVDRPARKFTKYNYDACGRITEVQYSDGSNETYTYRSDGEILGADNEAAKVKFERDVMGNVLHETVNDEWIASEYDAFSNRLKIASSQGANILHQYNKLGDVLQMQANEWIVKFKHDKLGLEVERILPGGISSQWQRDGIGRPMTHVVRHIASQVVSPNCNKQYLWDVNDRLKQIKDSRGSTQFEHDAWSNLSKTQFADGEIQHRNPDAVGNLFKTESRHDRKYARGGKLKKANGWEYKYDAEGNLIEKKHIGGGVWQYEWNDAGMLFKVIKPDKIEVTFAYDAFGRRLWKRNKNTFTKFIWDGNVPLHEWKEHALTGEKLSNINVGENGITTWIFDNNSFAPAAKIKGDKHYSIITDYLGTPSQMYRDDGSLMWDCELDSYGKVRMEKGDLGSCPFRYQGQYEDIEIRLYYNRFRYYAVEEGIYISKDPIRLASGEANFYRYVDDPNIWIDESGLYKKHKKNGQFAKKPGRKKVKSSTHGNSVNSKRPTQHYEIHDSKGRAYHGVGDVKGKRANQSLNRLGAENPKETFSIVNQTNYSNRKGALKAEHTGITATGGPGSPGNYNNINSPGAKL